MRRWMLAALIVGLVAVPMLGLAPVASATVFSNATSITLPDPNTTGQHPSPGSLYPSPIVVSGMTGTISSMTVTLSGLHMQYSQDVSALLVAPDGHVLSLFSSVGDNLQYQRGNSNGVNLTFDDSSANTYPYNTALPLTGSVTLKPADDTINSSASFISPPADSWPSPAPLLPTPTAPAGSNGARFAPSTGTGSLTSQFGAVNPNGTWDLYVTSTTYGDSGSFSGGWSLNITTANAATTSTSVTSSQNPSFTSQPNNTVTYTATVTSTGTVNQGTVAFTSDGTTIPGCGAVAVSNGQAACTTSFSAEGEHTIEAQYGANSSFGPSNASLTQEVDNHTTVSGSSYCNTGKITLPGVTNPQPYPQRVFVSGASGTISHLTVTLKGISDPYEQDINALLVGPNGKDLILVGNAGQDGAPSQPNPAANNVTLTFDDASSTTLGESTPWGATGASVTLQARRLQHDRLHLPLPRPGRSLRGSGAQGLGHPRLAVQRHQPERNLGPVHLHSRRLRRRRGSVRRRVVRQHHDGGGHRVDHLPDLEREPVVHEQPQSEHDLHRDGEERRLQPQ